MAVTRVSKTKSFSIVLEKKLRELAEKTRINQSKLLDEAIEDLLAKYQGASK